MIRIQKGLKVESFKPQYLLVENTYSDFSDGVPQSISVLEDAGTVSICVQTKGKFTLIIAALDSAAQNVL